VIFSQGVNKPVIVDIDILIDAALLASHAIE
jgi:hypothetical protein